MKPLPVPPKRAWLLGLVLAGPALAGCSSDPSDTPEEPQVTAIVIAPEDFLGTVPCLDAPGAMRLFTAELLRVAPPEDSLPQTPSTFPESLLAGPVRCEQGVAFGQVELGAGYAARLAAYDRADLVASSAADGSLVDPATGELVPPRWVGHCGCGADGIESCDESSLARAEYQVLRHVRQCVLEDTAPSPTRVMLLLDPSTSGVECGSADDAVASFVVYRDGERFAEADCGATLTFDAAPGELFELELLAFADGDGTEPAYGTVCSARALPGVTLTAECDRLSVRGGIEVPLATALSALGAGCDQEVQNLTVALDGSAAGAIEVARPRCGGSVRFADVEPGEHEIALRAEHAGEPLTATCSAIVEPGLTARPDCGE